MPSNQETGPKSPDHEEIVGEICGKIIQLSFDAVNALKSGGDKGPWRITIASEKTADPKPRDPTKKGYKLVMRYYPEKEEPEFDLLQGFSTGPYQVTTPDIRKLAKDLHYAKRTMKVGWLAAQRQGISKANELRSLESIAELVDSVQMQYSDEQLGNDQVDGK